MPNTKSAIKRERVEKRKRSRNKMIISSMKTVCKNALDVLETKNKEEALKSIKIAEGELDRAVCKGKIHRNKAARKKSRLMKKLNSIE
ncbi:MAG: 30S ribosomal protein S20 [Candidatus Eremiobacterota bacterium]